MNMLRTRSLFGRHTQTGATLAGSRLPDGWKVITPAPGSADRVVVGPGGVYYVTMTRRAGAMRISPTSTASDPVLSGCKTRATQLGRKLTSVTGAPTVVHPVVVVEGADVQVLEQPAGLTVVAAPLIGRYLGSQAPVLQAAGIQRLQSAVTAAC